MIVCSKRAAVAASGRAAVKPAWASGHGGASADEKDRDRKLLHAASKHRPKRPPSKCPPSNWAGAMIDVCAMLNLIMIDPDQYRHPMTLRQNRRRRMSHSLRLWNACIAR